MKIIARIKETSTGKTRDYYDHLSLNDDGTPNIFNWEENNYACDCNRSLFWFRAIGEEESEGAECPCGSERYLVNLIDLTTNEIIYKEYDDGR